MAGVQGCAHGLAGLVSKRLLPCGEMVTVQRRADRARRDRREEVIDAALKIIATRGIAALGTRSLAAQVGLSSGAIFKHFATLEAVLDAVAGRVEAVLDETFPPEGLGPVERLESFVSARGLAVGGNVGIMRLMLSEQFVLALPKGASVRLRACVKKTRGYVLKCLSEGQSVGVFRADLAAETLVPIVLGTVQMLALSTAKSRRREAEARAALESLMVLLRSRSGGDAARGRCVSKKVRV